MVSWAKQFQAGLSKRTLLSDPFYLFEHGFLFIRNKSRQVVPFNPSTLWPAQAKLYSIIRRKFSEGVPIRLRVLKARQMGLSTLIQALFYSWSAGRPSSGLVVGNSSDNTQWLFDMSKTFQAIIEERGDIILPALQRSRVDEMAWESTGSSLRMATAGSPNLGITVTRQLVHLSEYAFYLDSEDIMGRMLASVPLAAGTMIIIETTANGYGPFYSEWVKESQENGSTGFENVFLPWHSHPEYQLESVVPSLLTNDELSLQASYRLTIPQITWRRAKLREYHGDKARFNEMFPSSWREAFRISGTIRFDNIQNTLTKLLERLKPGKRSSVSGDPPLLSADPSGVIELFQAPKKGKEYVMASDVGEGLKGDQNIVEEGKRISTTYSTCSVRERESWELCATMVCRYPLGIFEEAANKLGRFYNDALWSIELPGPGEAVVELARAHEYPNLYRAERRDADNDFKLATEYGFRVTAQSKAAIESAWEEFVREQGDLVGSLKVVEQALTFIRDPKTGKTGPRHGCFSDLLMADMECIYLLSMGATRTKTESEAIERYKIEQSQRYSGEMY